MVDIQSKEVIDKISDELKVQPSLEIPRALAKDIQLTYGVNPLRMSRILAFVENRTTTASSVGMLVTATNKDTFITGIEIANVSSALADNTLIFVNGDIGGATRRLMAIHKLTLVAGNFNRYNVFPIPIKLDRGSNVQFTNAFTAGTSTTSILVYGYETDIQ